MYIYEIYFMDKTLVKIYRSEKTDYLEPGLPTKNMDGAYIRYRVVAKRADKALETIGYGLEPRPGRMS